MSYLTPARFRELGFGVDLSETEDEELTSLLSQASAVVDAYCNVPRIPQLHDFRGGSITGEQHTWRLPVGPLDVGQRRIYLWHWPVVKINQFRIHVTNTQYLEIAPTELYLNNSERWAEIVSYAVTHIGTFGALVVPNIGLTTPVAKTDYDYGWDFFVIEESLVYSDGQTWRAQNQWWHSTDDAAGESRDPIIERDGAVIETGFSIDYDEGTVVFDANQPAATTVKATYHHKLPRDLQYATGHIVAYLKGQAGLRAMGMSRLASLRVQEVEMRRAAPKSNLVEDLEALVPEAAILLSAYQRDNLAVR